VGIDVTASIARFYRNPPAWLSESDLAKPENVARLLRDLRADTPIQDLAARMGRSRYAVARWLQGKAEPRLPDFLHMIEATSQRVLDLVSSLVPIETLPSLLGPYQELSAARELVARIPWSPAVLLALQTEDYLALPKHSPGWISHRLGLPPEVEEECIRLLTTSGQIRLEGKRLRVARIQSIDTRSDPSAGKRLREWWAQVGIDHIRDGKPGLFSFNVFSVSQQDYERLQEMHKSYYRSMRAVVAASKPEQRVVAANVQLFPLDESASGR
jgi:transcriptional regulator with XRE-family HTH domain